jgi:hypothetical protein
MATQLGVESEAIDKLEAFESQKILSSQIPTNSLNEDWPKQKGTTLMHL